MAQRHSNSGIFPARSDWDDTRKYGYRNRDRFSAPPSDKESFARERGYMEDWHEGPHDFAGLGPKGYRRSDERLYEEICESLTLNPRVDPTEIEVKVKDGIVTLWGTVSDRDMKRLAEDVALDIAGVLDVHNKLIVGSRYQNQGMLQARWEEEKKEVRSRSKRKSQ